MFVFFFQAEDGIRDAQESRGLGDVYKRQVRLEHAAQRVAQHGALFWTRQRAGVQAGPVDHAPAFPKVPLALRSAIACGSSASASASTSSACSPRCATTVSYTHLRAHE